MAITQVRTVQRIETYPKSDSSAADTLNDGNPRVMVVYEYTFDDTSDAALPVTSSKVVHLVRYSDEANATATDVTGEDQLVQDICGGIWS